MPAVNVHKSQRHVLNLDVGTFQPTPVGLPGGRFATSAYYQAGYEACPTFQQPLALRQVTMKAARRCGRAWTTSLPFR